jgi:hypothetical protein
VGVKVKVGQEKILVAAPLSPSFFSVALKVGQAGVVLVSENLGVASSVLAGEAATSFGSAGFSATFSSAFSAAFSPPLSALKENVGQVGVVEASFFFSGSPLSALKENVGQVVVAGEDGHEGVERVEEPPKLKVGQLDVPAAFSLGSGCAVSAKLATEASGCGVSGTAPVFPLRFGTTIFLVAITSADALLNSPACAK